LHQVDKKNIEVFMVLVLTMSHYTMLRKIYSTQ
jgi:hypothetical protein